MGKADDSRRTKKIILRNKARNLAKATNENSKSYKQTMTQAKTATLKKETPRQKTKQTPIIASFITILGGFLWILEKNKQT